MIESRGSLRNLVVHKSKRIALEDHMYLGLFMEIDALRNIREDKEIFIDYGIQWNDAWIKHQKEWNKKISTLLDRK